MKSEAQAALDELFDQKLIPFRLTVYIVTSEGHGIYTVHFFDSRRQSVEVFWREGQSFREAVRAAVLNGARTTIPLSVQAGSLYVLKQVSQRLIEILFLRHITRKTMGK